MATSTPWSCSIGPMQLRWPRAELAFGEVMDLAISLGGTITGEHGVGTLKRGWLEEQIGTDVLSVMRDVKHALDPLGILNPGKAI